MNSIQSLKNIIGTSENYYLHYHARRFEQLVSFVVEHYAEEKRILDIGNSPFASMLSQIIKCKVDELGFLDDGEQSFGHQYKFDLNDAQYQERWRKDIGPYDMILFAEVIEHLYTSPLHTLSFLHSLLTPKGLLILQTPNAAVLHKRIQLLIGNNPYMLIRETRRNPGHFREYTMKELIEYANNCGYKVQNAFYGNYFDYRYTEAQSKGGKVNNRLRLINWFYNVMPPSFRPGITMILRKV